MLPYNPVNKRIGSYLIDAGLLTTAQVDVILEDQAASGLPFGEIAVARGWLQPKTLRFMLEKVIEVERELGEPLTPNTILQRRYITTWTNSNINPQS